LPLQVRQVPREMHRVLSRARADLDDASAIGERRAQHLEDRALVALTGVGEWQIHQARHELIVDRAKY
jgi:hypothetical protein